MCQYEGKYIYAKVYTKLYLTCVSIECKDGFYGVNCSQSCGQCDDEGVCDKTTGYCLMGCQSNFQPPFCKGLHSLSSIVNNDQHIY